ncbi:Hop-interacting THI143 [Olea europaea subsp. europaea]|uniref:Hop-interacting THI143 n=1 Tax=Olea europaea subsp. europaea TaxID=158383 RepID=A0A8S0UDC7_OLEEU|nr:Hop-interacting THI143 [Olea europaea subsp. europaea]
MGCVSSTLLNQDDEFSPIGGSSAFSHHIVSLTSTTYGLLTLDSPSSDHHSPTTTVPPTPTPPPPPPRFTLGSLFPSPLSEPRSLKPHSLETINYWDFASGLDADHIPSFRFSPLPLPPYKSFNTAAVCPDNDENLSPNVSMKSLKEATSFRKSDVSKDSSYFGSLDGFEKICPPNGEHTLVIYTTTLRGVRKTFEDCNAVRSAIEALGFLFFERDISMDKGFRDELKELLKGKDTSDMIPPKVFLKGRYIGGVEEVMRIVEEGSLGKLLQGLPRTRGGYVCEGCGGVRFLPCFTCNGSCKIVVNEEMLVDGKQGEKALSYCRMWILLAPSIFISNLRRRYWSDSWLGNCNSVSLGAERVPMPQL